MAQLKRNLSSGLGHGLWLFIALGPTHEVKLISAGDWDLLFRKYISGGEGPSVLEEGRGGDFGGKGSANGNNKYKVGNKNQNKHVKLRWGNK